MQSFEESAHDLCMAAHEFMKQLSHSFKPPEEMPADLPPVAQRLWKNCKDIVREVNSEEFDELL